MDLHLPRQLALDAHESSPACNALYVSELV